MRPLSDSEVVTLTDEEKEFWDSISGFSSWSYFFIIFGQFMFFRDVFTDLWSEYCYYTSNEWLPLGETGVVLVAASLFQSYHYYQDQEWIDANHKLLRDESPDSSNRNNNAQNAQETILPTDNPQACSTKTWEKIRFICQLFLFTTPFRAAFCWRDRKEKEKIMMQRRSRRIPIDRDEIMASISLSERDITDQALQMIELCCEALPQSILQIYFASRLGLEFQLNSTVGCIRLLSIGASVLFTAITSTKYYCDYFRHLKTLYFQAYYRFELQSDFSRMSWTSTLMLFILHLAVLSNRIYGISFMFVFYGQGKAFIFLVILYVVQYIWLQVYSSCRLIYENPPRGISTRYSNVIDRWMNMFTFHMLKPTFNVIFLYNYIFFFTMASCTKIFDTILPDNVLHTEEIAFPVSEANSTTTNNSTADNMTLTYSTAFSSFSYVLIYCAISTIVCLLATCFLGRQKESIINQQFPLMKGLPFWEGIMSPIKWDCVDLPVRRHICLFVLATDAEFYQLFDSVCQGIEYSKVNLLKLNDLWSYKVKRICPAATENFTALRVKWTYIKTQKSRNEYMTNIISLVDSAFSDGEDCVSIFDLQMFLNLVEHFELRLTERTSFRLMSTNQFVDQIIRHFIYNDSNMYNMNMDVENANCTL